METIILLLKEAVKQYNSGSVGIADNMLYTAWNLRKETIKKTEPTPKPKPTKSP